jgi:hypothetical protein
VCTQHARNDVTVCDVALPDVRDALRTVPAVRFTHLEGEGTRVVTDDPAAVAAFRDRLAQALAPHGGALPPAP